MSGSTYAELPGPLGQTRGISATAAAVRPTASRSSPSAFAPRMRGRTGHGAETVSIKQQPREAGAVPFLNDDEVRPGPC